DLFDGRLPAELLEEAARDTDQAVDRLDHVDGDADRAGLIGDGSSDRLPDPPCGVGRELVALLVIELLDRADEPDVPLLDEVQERHAATDVLLGDRNDEPQVGGGQLLARIAPDPNQLATPVAQLRVRGYRWIVTEPPQQV